MNDLFINDIELRKYFMNLPQKNQLEQVLTIMTIQLSTKRMTPYSETPVVMIFTPLYENS